MAFMEKPPAGKVLLDDTAPLSAGIEASQSLHSHTEYIIRVQRGIAIENSWQIVRRYSDFDLLNSSLQISGLSLPLPPKKLIGNMEREFIAERQKGLQRYLDVITTNHLLANCELVKKFLDPNNYSANYTEIALQQVSMFFRSEPKWEVVEPLKDIGWRIRKRYFLMKSKNQPKERLVLSWADLGPDKYLADKDFQWLIRLLPSCSHPHIYRVTFSTASESSALVIRTFNERGTLRDLIYKAKPKEPFLRKYGSPKKAQGLELAHIKAFGRQILEALKFLHDKGFPYGHLHASNVMLEGDTCRLLDLENSLLGLPSFYRPYFSQLRRINVSPGRSGGRPGGFLAPGLAWAVTFGWPPADLGEGGGALFGPLALGDEVGAAAGRRAGGQVPARPVGSRGVRAGGRAVSGGLQERRAQRLPPPADAVSPCWEGQGGRPLRPGLLFAGGWGGAALYSGPKRLESTFRDVLGSLELTPSPRFSASWLTLKSKPGVSLPVILTSLQPGACKELKRRPVPGAWGARGSPPTGGSQSPLVCSRHPPKRRAGGPPGGGSPLLLSEEKGRAPRRPLWSGSSRGLSSRFPSWAPGRGGTLFRSLPGSGQEGALGGALRTASVGSPRSGK
uniref:PX domain containing serine/threonine kinase like n=1 Tax=Monodelphis domestica TaxID=13616 RepID=A0A5F8GWQ1_MONDO